MTSITVNDNGGFFSSDLIIGPNAYAGGTLFAQASILVHEIAHSVGTADGGDSQVAKAAGEANDVLVDRNCGKSKKVSNESFFVCHFCFRNLLRLSVTDRRLGGGSGPQ